MTSHESAGQLPRPDLSGPDHHFTVVREMTAIPEAIFRAWTERFDLWFATPGLITMPPEVDEPYYFEVVHEGMRFPHYGRFLALSPGRSVELTWCTGKGGTNGAETVVTVEMTPAGSGALLRLTHSGFYEAEAAQQHADAWPRILAHLDERVSKPAV
jgi:uncharacterized protein YndB with AHSA1/START domain